MHRQRLLIALLALPIAALLSALEPYLLKIAIDNHLTQGDFTGAKHIALFLFIVVMAGYGVRYVYTYGLQYVGQHAVASLRERVYRKILTYELSIFDREPTGTLLSRTVSDAESLSESLATGIVSIFLDVLTILFTVGMMMLLSPSLAIAVLILLPLLWLITQWFGKKIRHTFIAVRESNSALNGFLNESLAGLQIIQLFRKANHKLNQFSRLNRAYCDATVKSNIYDASLYALMEGFSAICIGFLLWTLATPSLHAIYSAGLLIAFVEYLQRIFNPIKEFSAKIATIERAAVDLDRIFSVLNNPQTIESDGKPFTHMKMGVAFKNIRFRYRDKDPWVIDDVSFDLKKGETLAIVGSTGSGKSTLMKLLLRHYETYEGEILIDDKEIRTLNRRDLHNAVSLVAQDVFLFDGTILDNIALGRDGIDAARVRWALTHAHADAILARYPERELHVLKERGANLSLGEAQLFAFARALAGFGDLVILDEATGNIDTATEAHIEAAILEILSMKTTIVIAHRLSTLKRATRILVLEQGRIVESGSYAELIEKQGVYFRLYETQFQE